MNMKSRLILFALFLAASGFAKLPETRGLVLEIRMKNQLCEGFRDILMASENVKNASEPRTNNLENVPGPRTRKQPENVSGCWTSKLLNNMSEPRTSKQRENVSEPWTSKQLMAPADLAAIINDPNVKKPMIICVGPGALIKGSLDTGPANEKENLEKLRKELSKLPRDANVVIYCGCCPFEHCPNIRPAFILLNEMKFSNARLLNLEHNIKTDWVARGYPKAGN
jgi:hypothetical protein